MIGVIYARYSSDNQKEESIDGQLRECKAYAEKNGIQIVDTYIDRALSAKTDNRPRFQQMIKDSASKHFEVILVWKLDRFARTASEGSALVKELLERGVNVHILNMGLIENTATGRLILNVLLSFAEFERDMIVERTSDGKAVKRATDPNYKEGRKALEIPEGFEDYRSRAEAGEITVIAACAELGISRSTWYKWNRMGVSV